VRNQTIALHFSESQTTLSCTTLGWLTGENLHTTATAGVQLTAHQVMQSLVEDDSSEDVSSECLSSLPTDHRFTTSVRETISQQA
tara:strand:- start:28 stop:282 length:255 start_codon:yes stop_codon:yes gene_type:complete